MTASRILERQAPAPKKPSRARPAPVHFGDYLLPLSVLMWAVGLSRTHVPAYEPYGLITSLPVIYYAGIALLVISAVIELRHVYLSEWRLAAHAVVLIVMLFATAPIVYPAGRYSWLYKTIGVVQYINAHGQTNDTIDIYQNWPGFFALAGWFTKVAGVASPLAYAKWAQVVFELAALPLLYLIYDGLALPVKLRWVAIFLYFSANWVGQDYFSPQALGVVLSLGIMALAIRWLYVPRPRRNWPGRRSRGRGKHGSWSEDASTARGHRDPRGDERPSDRMRWWSFPREHDLRWSIAICITIVVIYYVLSAEHQLSPYMVAAQLGALAAAKMLRPRWLPVVLAAVALGYLLPHFGFVNSHFGLLSSIGHLFSNVKPPSQSTTPTTSASQILIARCSELLAVGMWFLALVGAWMRRRSGQLALALLLLAFSPLVVLAVQAYGNEGVLRAYLFSLPWSAALAASALAPVPRVVLAKTKNHRARVREQTRGLGTLRILAAYFVVIGLFFPAFFGNDSYNVMPASEVTILTAFQQSVPPGSTFFVPTDNFPFADTSNYNLIVESEVYGGFGTKGNEALKPDVGTEVLYNVLNTTSRNLPAYVIIAPSMITYNRAYPVVPNSAFAVLEKSLANTRPWKLIVHKAGIEIYELPPHTFPPHTLPVSGPSKPGASSSAKEAGKR
jgi:hypothetical protein